MFMNRRDFCKATVTSAAAVGVLPGVSPRGSAAEKGTPRGKDIPAVKLSGEATVISASAAKQFAANLRGRVITASDPDYDQARRIWNRMIDRRPALIVRCSGAADVQRAVAFARERELLLAVRGGGHSFPGYSMCNGGVVIDLSALMGVRVDPANKSAQVAGGAWIGDLDWESQQYGLATPMGRVSNTGVGGLTLGGGYGRLSRLHGLACDNLIGADLVTADAKLLRVSATENPDLFWAIRGGGGNFGVVTHFEFQLHAVGPQVLAGGLTYAPSQLRAVLEHCAELAPYAPRELMLDLAVIADERGVRTPYIMFCFAGPAQRGEDVLQSFRAATKPRHDDVRARDYVALQKEGDGPALAAKAVYSKTGYIQELTPALIDAVIQEPGTIALILGGGAIADVAPTDTALAHRSEEFLLQITAEWQDASQNDQKRAEVHAAWDRLSPFTKGFYSNLTNADQKSIEDNLGPNRARLLRIKQQFDPDNLFRLNANIQLDARDGYPYRESGVSESRIGWSGSTSLRP
jgi:FAD/FMN-containing dehydrogenase